MFKIISALALAVVQFDLAERAMFEVERMPEGKADTEFRKRRRPDPQLVLAGDVADPLLIRFHNCTQRWVHFRLSELKSNLNFIPVNIQVNITNFVDQVLQGYRYLLVHMRKDL